MTTGAFKYIDRASYTQSDSPFVKPWTKVDGGGWSFKLTDHERNVTNVRGQESNFDTNISGFQFLHSPAKEKLFTDEKAIREGYYPEVEALLRSKLSGVKKVVFFDHTIRRRDKSSPRQPVQQVHVDQTPDAAAVRVRRHLPADEAESLLKGRYQIINVWRPIENLATDFPLAVVDWRTTTQDDFVKVDLLYPKRERTERNTSPTSSTTSHPSSKSEDSDDDRGKETLPDTSDPTSTANYEVKGETYAVAPNENHRFYYLKDMTPEEVLLIKCFDSRSEWMTKSKNGVAAATPHTAFVDPMTPADAPGRQSIEVRSLVFYDD